MALTLLQNLYFRSEPLPGKFVRNNVFRQRSNAGSILLHHDDIQDLLQVCVCIHPNPSLTPVQGDEEGSARLLEESGVAQRVEIDEDGGKSRFLHGRFPSVYTRAGSGATGRHPSS